MKLDVDNILTQVAAQRDLILAYISSNGRKELFNDRLDQICPPGREKVLVELAVLCDCLSAIEAVLFSLKGSQHQQEHELRQFLQATTKLLIGRDKDKKLYREFAVLRDQSDCDRFLQTHYTDVRPFGGANRRTQWSGFFLSRQLSQLTDSNLPLKGYKKLFESVVVPLLGANEGIEDILELGGVWTAVDGANKSQIDRSASNQVPTFSQNEDMDHGIEMTDLNNPAILFDVIAGRSADPIVKVNSKHFAFQNGHSLKMLLRAWAYMESDAWDERKRVLEDVRTDWGRAARDLAAEPSGEGQ